jgi:hypothetical protein
MLPPLECGKQELDADKTKSHHTWRVRGAGGFLQLHLQKTLHDARLS